MATYDLEEQEQLEELKTWWKMHGTLVTAVIVALSLGVVGWQGWQWWQRNQAAQAGQLYAAMQQAMAQQDVKRVRMIGGELIDKFGGTAYAGMGAMLSGKALLETGDLKSAQAQFGWAAEHARDTGLRDLARLRQAIALAEDKGFDEALRLLAVPPGPTFQARYSELKGDIHKAQGKAGEARAAYDDALKQIKNDAAPDTAYREVLQAKRDAAGGGA